MSGLPPTIRISNYRECGVFAYSRISVGEDMKRFFDAGAISKEELEKYTNFDNAEREMHDKAEKKMIELAGWSEQARASGKTDTAGKFGDINVFTGVLSEYLNLIERFGQDKKRVEELGRIETKINRAIDTEPFDVGLAEDILKTFDRIEKD